MSRKENVEEILNKAGALEKKYDWTKATDLYEQALRMVEKRNFLRKAEIQEKLGYCSHRATFQAESREEFKERMQHAIAAYEKAHGFYEKLAGEQKTARMFRCKAIIKYLGYWLTTDVPKKKRLINDSLELASKAFAGFSFSGDMLEFGRTYNELSFYSSVFFHRIFREWDRQVMKKVVEKGIQWGDKAVVALSELGDSYEVARAYLTLAICVQILEWFFIAEPEKQEQHRLKAVRYISKAADLSEKVGDTFLLGMSHFWLGFNTDGEESIRHFEKGIECGEETHDKFLKGMGLDFLAYMTYWKATVTEDPDRRRKLAEEAMEFYDKAQHLFSIISLHTPRGGVIAPPGGYAEHYLHLAEWETDVEKKLAFLEKSEKAGTEALKVAENSYSPNVISFMLHILSKTLEARARLEPDSDERRRLLEKALKYIERGIEIHEQWKPFIYWNMGVMYNFLADIKAELGYLEPDLDSKMKLLEEAVSNKEKCLKLTAKQVAYYEKKGAIVPFASLYGYQDTYGTLLNRLYELTSNPKYLGKAIEISQEAIETAIKLDMVSLMAESYWKIAKAQDILGDHLKAAESFERASESYTKAAEKIPQLKEFYKDYASYMQAWNEIEKAKHHHAEKQYGHGREHYEKAADLHTSTESWSYLSPNYLGWARLEEAEDLSRREQAEEAKDLFEQAAKLFVEAKQSITAELEKIEARDEKETAAKLAQSSNTREGYCRGRTALEEAKILDRQGDHVASSKKYGSAAEMFLKIAKAESDQSRKELQPIIYLCKAWQKMMMAETKASSALYGEAAELFKQAKEYTVDQPTSLLALANSSFCKALEAGTEFEITRDVALYSTAKKHLEASANYYLKSGFKNASEYAKATQRLFDAYVYMNKAQTEIEPGKKVQYYRMAEKLLQASAGAYMKAKHPEKSEEVQRLLESVKEEQQLAMSLTEVLRAPTIASTTTSFSTLTPTHEQATGLERFEHADIQASLILGLREVKVGDDVDFEIELVNAGKAPALLIKLEKVIPEDFEVKEVPDVYRVEDSYLNLKGRRLDPLKTEDVKIVVKPRAKGTFTMNPRILYIDEAGKYKSHEPEPVTITVKELGIRGWIKGER